MVLVAAAAAADAAGIHSAHTKGEERLIEGEKTERKIMGAVLNGQLPFFSTCWGRGTGWSGHKKKLKMKPRRLTTQDRGNS